MNAPSVAPVIPSEARDLVRGNPTAVAALRIRPRRSLASLGMTKVRRQA